jgi:hypothetical protein
MALHRSGNFLREVHDTVKGCQAGNAAICYQLISQNAEKIVAYNRMAQRESRPFDYDDPQGLYSGVPSCQENPFYSGSSCQGVTILLSPEEYWYT